MNGLLANTSFLIPAAGQGTRLGLGPKALLVLDGKPLIRWLAEKALRCTNEVLIAAPPDLPPEIAALCPECLCIAGGDTRQESIARLARASHNDWLLLQDVARPFASPALIERVAAAARASGCAGAFLDPEVPVARIRDGLVSAAYLRDEVAIFQAPQAFSRAVLLEISRLAELSDWREQSTVQLALRCNVPVHAVTGEKTNIKLSTPEDWAMARHLTQLLR